MRGSPSTTGEVVASLGVGVAGMQERVRQLGGRLEITSGEKGTCVRTMLPKAFSVRCDDAQRYGIKHIRVETDFPFPIGIQVNL